MNYRKLNLMSSFLETSILLSRKDNLLFKNWFFTKYDVHRLILVTIFIYVGFFFEFFDAITIWLQNLQKPFESKPELTLIKSQKQILK